MKPAFTFTVVALALVGLAPLAHADYWATLAGAQDSIHIKSGETALLMATDEPAVIQYNKGNKRPVQFEFGGQVYRGASFYHPYHHSVKHLRGQYQRPVALTGPATISLKTTNVVSIQVVQTQMEKPQPARTAPPSKATLWQSLAKR